MATVKAEELRAKTADELKDQLVDLKKEQFNLRFQTAGGQNENPARARIVRREIARIKTVLGEIARTLVSTPTRSMDPLFASGTLPTTLII